MEGRLRKTKETMPDPGVTATKKGAERRLRRLSPIVKVVKDGNVQQAYFMGDEKRHKTEFTEFNAVAKLLKIKTSEGGTRYFHF